MSYILKLFYESSFSLRWEPDHTASPAPVKWLTFSPFLSPPLPLPLSPQGWEVGPVFFVPHCHCRPFSFPFPEKCHLEYHIAPALLVDSTPSATWPRPFSHSRITSLLSTGSSLSVHKIPLIYILENKNKNRNQPTSFYPNFSPQLFHFSS